MRATIYVHFPRRRTRTLGRYHTLVAINTRLPQADLHAKHHSVLATLEPLIQRGQRDGSFRPDVPAAWHLSMILALVHATSAELQAGRIPAEHAEAALLATILGAITTDGLELPVAWRQ